ncbi:hypothetical protein FYK55_26595 [Roseiconus nitratireducens]|uniref:Uncharacterized protein n=1 Tax=Roseiconus nitratireducens TaxID=2605748 RepID=A0A5M6CWK2_9BACT|nr:hypothetical protein [Roseiconus nitratireducens]KAA5538770.1 hypothetical protein FYK55_26595 [Roseiconus nitratireducens]
MEKVFSPGRLTRAIYRIAFAAPFAYQNNRHAAVACFYRRRVAAALLRSIDSAVGVAAPLYVRYDRGDGAWVLAARWVDGRGPKPDAVSGAGWFDAQRDDDQAEGELPALIRQMSDVEQELVRFGLTGSGWQVAPAALVSTANLLIPRRGLRVLRDESNDSPELVHNASYQIIDLESGIPAVLLPRYLKDAWLRGSAFPFDDLDVPRLRAQSERLTAHWLANGCDKQAFALRSDVQSLIFHTRRWKATEVAWFRQPWSWMRARRRTLYRRELISRWKRQQVLDRQAERKVRSHLAWFALIWCMGLIPFSSGRWLQRLAGNTKSRRRLVRWAGCGEYRRRVDHLYRQSRKKSWINTGRIGSSNSVSQPWFLMHTLMSWISPAALHRFVVDRDQRRRRIWQVSCLIGSRTYQDWVGRRLVGRWIDRWVSREWMTVNEATRLAEGFHEAEVGIYARGMAMHLAAKGISPFLAPLKIGGVTMAATGSWIGYALIPFAILPALRTLITLSSLWIHRRQRVPHGEALLVGLIPTLGSSAFAVQMWSSNRAASSFLIRDMAARVGRHLPVYGGADSRTEHWMLRQADRFITLLAAARRMVGPWHRLMAAVIPVTNQPEKAENRLSVRQATRNRGGSLIDRWTGVLIAEEAKSVGPTTTSYPVVQFALDHSNVERRAG